MSELALVELGVEALLPEQAFVGSLLYDMAVTHDENHIRLLDGGKTMGDDEAGSALHHGVKGLLHLPLRPGIDGGGGLVQ